MKRLFDIMFSCIAVGIFMLPSLITILFLTCKEKHSILFKQERIGKNKKPFMILKFRTMTDGVPTPTGKFLRKTGLDEVPQFINVLRGELSIVGPRALTQFDIDRLGWNDNHHAIRWECKPGITGPAQLYGGQHRKTSWFWDKRYIKTTNLITDFVIVALSFMMNIFGKTKVRRIIFQQKNLR